MQEHTDQNIDLCKNALTKMLVHLHIRYLIGQWITDNLEPNIRLHTTGYSTDNNYQWNGNL